MRNRRQIRSSRSGSSQKPRRAGPPEGEAPRDALALPFALGSLDEILSRAGARDLALFLDYDGTLTPIVADPEMAILSPRTRATVARLASLCQVAILSGRDLEDVVDKVGIDGLWVAGSHGFDLLGPGGRRSQAPEAEKFLVDLAAAEREIREAIREIRGARIEAKRFAVTVHFRAASEPDLPMIEAAVDRAHRHRPSLRKLAGKKIYELQPDIGWDKGIALLHILGGSGLSEPFPVYIGDDTTDEDAFRILADRGVGIVVSERSGPTAAAYRLADPDEVERFLATLADRLEENRGES